MNHLIIVNGYFGDIAFSTSIARRLACEGYYLDYLIGFPQMKDLLENYPYIQNVFVSDPPSPQPSPNFNIHHYDNITRIGQMSFEIPPPFEMQQMAGVPDPDNFFEIYTNSEYDTIAKNLIDDLRKEHNKPVVCVMGNWQERSYIFTKEEYIRAVDVPGYGYGGKHRNVPHILNKLKDKIHFIEIGFPSGTPQLSTIQIPSNDQKSILFECSLMKYCDAFLGAEGGLCNLAYAVGTRTITTGDFVLQLYGWNGAIKKIKEPKLGPIHYRKNTYPDHVELDPYLTDDQVADKILEIIC